jgi:putative serine protease PepD
MAATLGYDERNERMNRRKHRLLLFAALVTAAGLAAGGGAATYAAISDDSTNTVVREVTVADSEPAASENPLSVNQIYRRAYKGVVQVTVSSQADSPFGGSQTQRAQGSGLVYDSDGHIVTNQHVVDGAESISVRLWNGKTYSARVVGTDSSTDLAVLKIDAPSSVLVPLTLGNSDKVAVGDGVVAIGSPFGLAETVTSGIVSALHRQMTAPNGFAIDDSIQTDAAINHGNSGGPLLNQQGRVIGVNAQIESESGGNDGVGFAIPSNTVRSVVSQILATGKAEHAYLGVSLDGNAAQARVAEVRSGTPAAEAGLKAGDVVTAIDGSKISSADDLQSVIGGKKPGDTISLTYTRDGKSHTVSVKLGTRPS